jgi:parvulin-like peptidyl-prolyl isomerase
MMFRNTFFVILLGGILLLLGRVPTIGHCSEDAILAVVNDEVITQKDLRDYTNALMIQLKTEGRSPAETEALISELEKNGIERLIEERLIITEANTKGVVVNAKIIDDRIAQIKSRFASEEDFLNAILDDGVTVTDLRNKISDQLKVKFLVDEEVRSKIYVNPQEVTEFYHANINKFEEPERVELESIFIGFNDNRDVARTKADQALMLLREGKDFSAVAKEFTEGPSIGIVRKGELLSVIENAVFPLKKGDMSDKIEAENGIYIFKVKNKFPAETESLENVKEEISKQIFQNKFQEQFQIWISKLQKSAFIEIKG